MPETPGRDNRTVEQFLDYNEGGLRGFHEDDSRFIAECFGIGASKDSLKERIAKDLLAEAQHRYDDFESEAGMSREEVLVLACLTSRIGFNWLTPEQREPIFDKLEAKLGGKDKAAAILLDGYESFTFLGRERWSLEEPMSRPIHAEVEAAVDEFLAERQAAARPAVEPIEEAVEPEVDVAEIYGKLSKTQKRQVEKLAGSLNDEQMGALKAAPQLPAILGLLGLKLTKDLTSSQTEFYKNLADLVIWRRQAIKEAEIPREAVRKELENLQVITGVSNYDIKDLIARAEVNNVALPQKYFVIKGDSAPELVIADIDAIGIHLEEGWQVGRTQIQFKEGPVLINKSKPNLNDIEVLARLGKMAMPEGFSLLYKNKEGTYELFKDGKQLGEASSLVNFLSLSWAKGLEITEALEATQALGQIVLNFLEHTQTKFPVLSLVSGGAQLAVEPTGTAPEAQHGPPAPEPAPAPVHVQQSREPETSDWLKELEAPTGQPPAAEEEPKKGVSDNDFGAV